MDKGLVHFIPIVTMVVSILFAAVLYRRWRQKPGATYLAWWMVGLATYAVGTLTESLTTLLGWNPWVFRAWYISGALLGGAPLAQGTAYLFLPRRWANWLTLGVGAFIVIAGLAVMLAPLDLSQVEEYRLSGRVLGWQWVRAFSPFINTYALIFLVGGALWSAWRYWRRSGELGSRVVGNLAIALGGILPGIGGTFTRFGLVEVLYVTELLGVILIWIGYRLMVGDGRASIHVAQRQAITAGES